MNLKDEVNRNAQFPLSVMLTSIAFDEQGPWFKKHVDAINDAVTVMITDHLAEQKFLENLAECVDLTDLKRVPTPTLLTPGIIDTITDYVDTQNLSVVESTALCMAILGEVRGGAEEWVRKQIQQKVDQINQLRMQSKTSKIIH